MELKRESEKKEREREEREREKRGRNGKATQKKKGGCTGCGALSTRVTYLNARDVAGGVNTRRHVAARQL